MARRRGSAIDAVGPPAWKRSSMTWRLETERLRLRPLSHEDLDASERVVSDPVSMRFYVGAFDRPSRSRAWTG